MESTEEKVIEEPMTEEQIIEEKLSVIAESGVDLEKAMEYQKKVLSETIKNFDDPETQKLISDSITKDPEVAAKELCAEFNFDTEEEKEEFIKESTKYFSLNRKMAESILEVQESYKEFDKELKVMLQNLDKKFFTNIVRAKTNFYLEYCESIKAPESTVAKYKDALYIIESAYTLDIMFDDFTKLKNPVFLRDNLSELLNDYHSKSFDKLSRSKASFYNPEDLTEKMIAFIGDEPTAKLFCTFLYKFINSKGKIDIDKYVFFINGLIDLVSKEDKEDISERDTLKNNIIRYCEMINNL